MVNLWSNASFISTEPNVSTNDVIVGWMLIITSSLGTLFYLPVVYVMATSKLLKAPCYKFMTSLAITDIISLMGWIVIGIYTLRHGQDIPYTVIIVTMCLLVVGWGSLTSHLFVIAIYMKVVICYPHKERNVFNVRNVRIMLAACYFYAIVVHALPTFIPPNMRYNLTMYTSHWEQKYVAEYYLYEDIVFCVLVCLIGVYCYMSICSKFAKLGKIKSLDVSPGSETPIAVHEDRKRRRQIKLTLQTALRFVTFVVYDILFYVFTNTKVTTNLWVLFVCTTYLWCLNNALSPFIYILFNNRLREALLLKKPSGRRSFNSAVGKTAVTSNMRINDKQVGTCA